MLEPYAEKKKDKLNQTNFFFFYIGNKSIFRKKIIKEHNMKEGRYKSFIPTGN